MRSISKLSGALMTLALTIPAFAQEKAAPGGTMNSFGGMITMILLMVVVFYFFMIRPEQKKQKDRQTLLSNLKKGDKIVTIGGIMGTVQSVKDSSVQVRVADNTVLEFTKAAIANVTKEGAAAETAADDSKEKKK
jgi:preprotein translocase subunit YajC